MNGTTQRVVALVDELARGLDGSRAVETAICPPLVYLGLVGPMLKSSPLMLGAQNVSDQPSGAYTGETAASMLRDLDCELVIVGHSERRHLYGETDAVAARKFAAAERAGLVPVLCIGERREEREASQTEACVARQLDAILESESGGSLGNAVVAYEPVWAIGTGRTATPEQAEEVHAFIRRRVAAKDAKAAESLRILYGGSVNPANAKALFSMPNIDGGLIGGASLVAADFLAICEAAR